MAQLQIIESGVHQFGEIVLTDADIDQMVTNVMALQERHRAEGTLTPQLWDARKATDVELDLMLAKKRAYLRGAGIRAAVEQDIGGRLPSRAPVAVHEESGDPSEILGRVVKRLMTETPSLSYEEALKQAQMEHRDLAAQILKQLNEYRAR